MPDERRVEVGLEALVEVLFSERVIVPVEFAQSSQEGGAQSSQEGKEKHSAIEFVRVSTLAGDALAVYSSVEALAHDRPQ